MNERPTHPVAEHFQQLNASLDKQGRRLTLAQRIAILSEHVESVGRMSVGDTVDGWLQAFESGNDDEVELLGKMLHDVFKHDQAVPGRSGPKPGRLEPGRVWEMLRQFVGDDHTVLPFTQMFTILKAERTLRAMAAKTGLSKNKVDRLLRGAEPSKDDMERVAGAFKKHPSFFMEYRVRFLQADLLAQLESLPEASIDLYRKRVSRQTNGGHG